MYSTSGAAAVKATISASTVDYAASFCSICSLLLTYSVVALTFQFTPHRGTASEMNCVLAGNPLPISPMTCFAIPMRCFAGLSMALAITIFSASVLVMHSVSAKYVTHSRRSSE